MESIPMILGESGGLRKMIKRCLLDMGHKQGPEDLERRAEELMPKELERMLEELIRTARVEGLIKKAFSAVKGAKVALISQNERVAFGMLYAFLGKNVNVDSILLGDEKSHRYSLLKSRYSSLRTYSRPRSYSKLYMQKTMQSMRDAGIEYFIIMAQSDKIPQQVVQKFHGKLWNVHDSVLPRYMGVGNPVREQLKQGDKYGGVTLQYVGEEIDRGDVLVRYKKELIYDGEPRELENPSRTLVDRNYTRVIIPTAAEVCAFAIKNIDRIRPMPIERLRSASGLSPNKMIYARK